MKQIITTKKGTTYERNWNVKEYYGHLNIRIDIETLNKLKNIANEKKINYSDIVRDLIKDYLESEMN